MPETILRPTTTDKVRLRTGDVETLASVLAVETGQVTLGVPEPISGAAAIVFAHPRGVVELAGTVEPADEGVVFTISDQRRLEQRRGAFRLAVAIPVQIARAGGERLSSRTGDLSTSGVRVLDAAELAVEEPVELEIDLGDGVCARLTGEVVRHDGTSVGVTFDDVPSAIEAQISAFISETQRRRLRHAA